MSRIGRMPITLPAGVSADIEGSKITIKGPKGTLSRVIDSCITMKLENGEVVLTRNNDSNDSKAKHGLYRALIANMVKGVSDGFEKKLQLVGVGYRAQAQGKALNLSLGFSHPVVYNLPDGITAQTPSQTEIVISGADRQKVGQVAAEIRGFRPPEPYKGKGVRYADETVVLKETKKK